MRINIYVSMRFIAVCLSWCVRLLSLVMAMIKSVCHFLVIILKDCKDLLKDSNAAEIRTWNMLKIVHMILSEPFNIPIFLTQSYKWYEVKFNKPKIIDVAKNNNSCGFYDNNEAIYSSCSSSNIVTITINKKWDV